MLFIQVFIAGIIMLSVKFTRKTQINHEAPTFVNNWGPARWPPSVGECKCLVIDWSPSEQHHAQHNDSCDQDLDEEHRNEGLARSLGYIAVVSLLGACQTMYQLPFGLPKFGVPPPPSRSVEGCLGAKQTSQ